MFKRIWNFLKFLDNPHRTSKTISMQGLNNKQKEEIIELLVNLGEKSAKYNEIWKKTCIPVIIVGSLGVFIVILADFNHVYIHSIFFKASLLTITVYLLIISFKHFPTLFKMKKELESLQKRIENISNNQDLRN